MAPDKGKLTELSEVASQLNSESDSLNELFQVLDAELAEMKLGVSVWLNRQFARSEAYIPPRERQEEYPLGRCDDYDLGYAKVGEEWHICIRKIRMRQNPSLVEGWEEEPTFDSAATPITQAPRAVRAEAAGYLNDLLDALTKKAGEYIANIQKAKDAVKKA
jgi:hypothetical protein